MDGRTDERLIRGDAFVIPAVASLHVIKKGVRVRVCVCLCLCVCVSSVSASRPRVESVDVLSFITTGPRLVNEGGRALIPTHPHHPSSSILLPLNSPLLATSPSPLVHLHIQPHARTHTCTHASTDAHTHTHQCDFPAIFPPETRFPFTSSTFHCEQQFNHRQLACLLILLRSGAAG